MLLQLYAFVVLSWDALCLLIQVYFAFLEACWHLICPPRQKSVKNEIAVIIGASRGVGRELALQLGALGAHIVCCDIDNLGNKKTALDISQNGGNAVAYQVDVTDREQVLKMADKIKNDVGLVSMIIHCCGMPSPHSLVAQPPRDIRATVDRSVMSHFWILQALLPHMQEQRKGHIVALSSVAGLTGIKDQVPLSVSQFAVKGLTESLRQELRTSQRHAKIQVTLVHIYPFLVSPEYSRDIRLRIPSYFGTLDPREAARQIIVGVRQGYAEMSVPGYLLFMGNLLRLLPREISVRLRELLDTGVDFG
ncbi:17-beta-hydroxysteroid dehydrogenase 13 [Frankliniella fusca]|uniref:17-beta-hydroxysteroid dehydrogenase 13 n=1 Tax=Frankliniella fusca TaxID=407009 RepID=A0AAE1HUB6_9NEOP|nr:17-beta-hydroxysteroid dehydrogenase 13 [Frankliniella fusca]